MKYIFDKKISKVVPKPEPPSNVIEMIPLPPHFLEAALTMMDIEDRLYANFGYTRR